MRLWHKIETREDPEWTRRYHATDPDEIAFGGRVEIIFKDGSRLVDELGVANAHPNGARPFAREQYIAKFRILDDQKTIHYCEMLKESGAGISSGGDFDSSPGFGFKAETYKSGGTSRQMYPVLS